MLFIQVDRPFSTKRIKAYLVLLQNKFKHKIFYFFGDCEKNNPRIFIINRNLCIMHAMLTI
jgi:hypothetical protein